MVIQPTTQPTTQAVQTTRYKGHTLTWEEHSSGDHTFIMIAGHGNVRTMWLPVIEHLTDLGRWVSLDLVGHYPARTPNDFTYLNQETLLDIQEHAVREIAGDTPVTLVGHSTGGFVALGVAAQMPQQVQRVISLSSVVWGPPTGFLKILRWFLEKDRYPGFWLAGKFMQMSPAQLVFGASLYTNHPIASLRNPLAWQIYRASHPWFRHHSLFNLAVVLRTLDTCDIRSLVTALPTPVLAVSGICDPIVPPTQTLWLAETLPNVDLHLLDHIGHVLYVEAHDTLIQLIRTWVADHPV